MVWDVLVSLLGVVLVVVGVVVVFGLGWGLIVGGLGVLILHWLLVDSGSG